MINSTFTIGITGNIATGKSVIRRMLANAGIFGIDADNLAHRMTYPDGPAFQSVIDAFGEEIKTDQHTISNQKLGRIVFNDPARLSLLESLVHPAVIDATIKRVKAARRPAAAVEAIKLLESGLGNQCDSIWVSYASYQHQIQRLAESRGMSADDADLRIKTQPPQTDKFTRADVIINTETSFKETWLRTQSALNDTIQPSLQDSPLNINSSQEWSVVPVNSFPISLLESAWEDLSGEHTESLFEQLGMNMVFPIVKEGRIMAFVVWEDWNFTATLKEVFPSDFLKQMPELVFDAFTKHALRNQSEIMFVNKGLINDMNIQPDTVGLSKQDIEQLSYQAWKIAAQKAASGSGSSLWVNILSQPFERTGGTTIS